ncbi:MAD2L1-binding protein [Spea bombifrons]|uniref:MAD2L1-binding protein n=1 Tax=Spea bombifrons TaxID=233779 RepID=UPI00234BC48A|nr:MAD2L1-binding protein [Spea bombifrons]
MERPEPDVPPRRPRGHPQCAPDERAISVVFPGLVTRESCYRFTCELLKHILHQRFQLPLPYEQLVLFTKKQPAGDDAVRRCGRAEATDSRQCQRAMSDLEELLTQLESLFTLTPVPRVLLLLGGSPMNPKEMYEIDMEGVQVGNGEQSLSARPCLRQIFRSLFVADPFSDLRSTSLMSLVVMVLAHRDCGTDWFRPKLNFKVPSRGRALTVRLSCSEAQTLAPGGTDFVWFQAPLTVKGFQN